MCITKPPAAPGAGKAPHDPTKKTKTPCKKCWIEDYEKEISGNPYGRYSEAYCKNGLPHHYSRKIRYKIFVHLKSLNTVIVKVRFKMNPQAGVSDPDTKAAKIKMTKKIKALWNSKFSLEVDDPICGKKILKIYYRVAWVTSDQHFTVNLYNIPTQPKVSNSTYIMDVSTKSSPQFPMSDWTYAHEFGHCVGLPDEYSYIARDTETVKYYKPDGTLDTAIVAPPRGKYSNAPDATIMSSDKNTIILKRHAWNIAIEVQELLRSKLGRNIKCSVI
jgi:hypothetical protein